MQVQPELDPARSETEVPALPGKVIGSEKAGPGALELVPQDYGEQPPRMGYLLCEMSGSAHGSDPVNCIRLPLRNLVPPGWATPGPLPPAGRFFSSAMGLGKQLIMELKECRGDSGGIAHARDAWERPRGPASREMDGHG